MRTPTRVCAIGHGFDVYYGFDPTVPIETANLKKFIRSQSIFFGRDRMNVFEARFRDLTN